MLYAYARSTKGTFTDMNNILHGIVSKIPCPNGMVIPSMEIVSESILQDSNLTRYGEV